MKSFGEQLKESRKSVGLTQVQLANRARLSVSLVQGLESGRHQPILDSAVRLAQALRKNFKFEVDGVPVTLEVDWKARRLSKDPE